MRRVEIWTVQGEHMVFYDVLLCGPTEREKFFMVRRKDKTDYIPSYDIRRVTVTDNGRDGEFSSEYARSGKKVRHH